MAKVIVDGLAFGEGPRWHGGRLWFSDMHAHVVQSLDPTSGEVVQRVGFDRGAFACMLGGDDRRTLFVLTARDSDPVQSAATRTGQIVALQVDVPGAGLP